MFSLLVALVTIIHYTWSQDTNCDFVQNVLPGKTYSIFSPNYPGEYGRGIQCRWVANCPPGYNCRVDCSTVNIPQSPFCSTDRLLISLSGDPTMNNADIYCSTGSITNRVSTGQHISMSLMTASNSSGGVFLCELRAQVAKPPSRCRCGYRNMNRIVGGEETGENEFPMMALVMKLSLKQFFFGAVIIHHRYIVSAAHPFQKEKNLSDYEMQVGVHTLFQDSPAKQRLYIADFIIHPNFDNLTYDYDIVLLKTTRDIEFNDRVGPACLPFKFMANDLTGQKVEALGWGTLEPGGPTSKTLRKVQLDVISVESCKKTDEVTKRQLCTYTPGKDACQHDTGGPILYTDPNTGLLFHVGIISYGRICATDGYPGINTRVTEMLTWMLFYSRKADYCLK